MSERIPYLATAVRPSWPDLPGLVQDAVVALVGEPVSWSSAGGGFTRGFASTLVHGDGRRSFVKAVPFTNPHITASYRREAAVQAVLPEGARAPRLLGAAEVGEGDDGWVVLAFEHVAGRMPGVPWDARDLTDVVAALEQVASSLQTIVWDDPTTLADFAGEGSPSLELWPHYDASSLPQEIARFVVDQRDRLHVSTARSLEVFAADGWAHCDVRADNLLVDDTGGVWLVDWNWLCRAPAWVDLALLLPQVHADGVDLRPAYRSPLLAGVSDDDVDSAVAWLAAFMLHSSQQPVFEGGSPWIRPHQLRTAEACLGLLAERWGA